MRYAANGRSFKERERQKIRLLSLLPLPCLNTELIEKRKSQQKLLLKYLNDDPAIVPHFVQLNQKFEEVAALEQAAEKS
jgi:hypothetical protein